MDEQSLNVLDLTRDHRSLKKGQVLFHEKDHPHGVYCIHKGRVKVYKTGVDGKEQIVRIAGQGDLLGHRSILSEERHPVTAETLGPSEICFIPKADFDFLLKQDPSFYQELFREVCKEMNQMTDLLTDLAQRPVRERLALALLKLNEIYRGQPSSSEEESPWIDLPRSDLANIVGTANETLARLLSELKEEGILEVNGRSLRIQDPAYLENIAWI